MSLAILKTDRVDAAVAYATDSELFSWCWENSIPLRFWGRFDEQVPVSIHILETFLSRRSGRYTCKLVRKFHPKVIWWRGFGVYIGSANLTQSAWWNNVEAGVFLTEDELAASGQDSDLETMLNEIDRHAALLTEELLSLLRKRNTELSRRKSDFKRADDAFENTTFVPHWAGLVHVSKATAQERKRQAFLDEWNRTLQIIRDIGVTISEEQNRPAWVGDDVPIGAQADQFLHAYYYNHVVDDRRRSNYEPLFAKNRKNPDAAVLEAIKLWKRLPQSSEESRTLNKVAPFLRKAFARDQLKRLTEDQFVKVLAKIHAATEYARRVSNRPVGLSEGAPYTIPQKIDALARRIYLAPAVAHKSALQFFRNVVFPHSIGKQMSQATR